MALTLPIEQRLLGAGQFSISVAFVLRVMGFRSRFECRADTIVTGDRRKIPAHTCSPARLHKKQFGLFELVRDVPSPRPHAAINDSHSSNFGKFWKIVEVFIFFCQPLPGAVS